MDSNIVDKQTVIIAGAIAGAIGVSITILGGTYRVFSESLETTGAIIVSVMSLILFALLVLSIDNRIRINQVKRGDGK